MGDFWKGDTMKKITAFTIAAALAFLHTSPTVYASGSLPTVTVQPANLLNVQVVDEKGNPVNGVSVSFKDSTGEYVGRAVTGERFYSSYTSNIYNCTSTSTEYPDYFYIPWSEFEAMIPSGYVLHEVYEASDDTFSSGSLTHSPSSFYFEEETSNYIQLGYHPAAEESIRIEPNQWGVYIDPKWKDNPYRAYLEVDESKQYLNLSDTGNNLYGKLLRFSAPAGSVKNAAVGSDNFFHYDTLEGRLGSKHYLNYLECYDEATEYVKCRMYLPDIFKDHDTCIFTGNTTFTIDGRSYDLAKPNPQTAAILSLQSGAMSSVVIPDKDGYVEFYTKESSRHINAVLSYHYLYGSYGIGGSWTSQYCSYTSPTKRMVVKAANLPDTGVNMASVPAGTYTVTCSDLPKGYAEPKITSVTVKDSKDYQYLKLTLERKLLLGDVNLDIDINAADAALLLKAGSAIGSGGASGLTDAQKTAADVDGDGTCNAVDAALILQYAAYVGTGGTQTIEEFLNRT